MPSHSRVAVADVVHIASAEIASKRLPVIVIMEELDGIARRRGLDQDGIYDRIQTTLLQRLDHTSNPALRDSLIVIFATTNVPHLLDPAWIRRVGGRTYTFGRLRRRAFAAVLDKQLGKRPLASENGTVQAELPRPLVHHDVSGRTALSLAVRTIRASRSASARTHTRPESVIP